MSPHYNLGAATIPRPENYPKVSESDESDAKQFTKEERAAIDEYTTSYKPSLDLAKVEAESKQLAKSGFPQYIKDNFRDYAKPGDKH